MRTSGQLRRETEAISIIDHKIVKPIVDDLKAKGVPFRIAILPDHATP
ncbi:MAG: hypothetical protein ACLUSP_03255 [Christensenellales bacterium]